MTTRTILMLSLACLFTGCSRGHGSTAAGTGNDAVRAAMENYLAASAFGSATSPRYNPSCDPDYLPAKLLVSAASEVLGTTINGDSAFATVKVVSVAEQVENPRRADGLITTIRLATDTLHWVLLRDSTAEGGWSVCGYPREQVGSDIARWRIRRASIGGRPEHHLRNSSVWWTRSGRVSAEEGDPSLSLRLGLDGGPAFRLGGLDRSVGSMGTTTDHNGRLRTGRDRSWCNVEPRRLSGSQGLAGNWKLQEERHPAGRVLGRCSRHVRRGGPGGAALTLGRTMIING